MSVPPVEQPHMRFDWTLNLGQILTLAAMIIAGLAAWFNMKTDLRLHEERIERLETQYKTQWEQVRTTSENLNKIATDIAVIRDRMERSNTNALQNGNHRRHMGNPPAPAE